MTGPVCNAAKRVLVVEDEMLIGMLLEDMLADIGHEVVAVVSRLKDALAAVEKETFDLAILDVHLHGEAAFPVAETLAAAAFRSCLRPAMASAGCRRLSRPAGAAKAVRQGRPGARTQGFGSAFRIGNRRSYRSHFRLPARATAA